MTRASARRRRILSAAVAVLVLTGACTGQERPSGRVSSDSPEPQPTTRTVRPDGSGRVSPSPEGRPARPRVAGTVVSGLAVPWGIAFLPDGRALVSERDTTRVVLVPAGGGRAREVGRLEQARPRGEAGLLGLATSPTFESDSLVYAYLSTETDNRVVRMAFDGRSLGRPEVVLDGIPNGFVHDGGRLEFGPDGHLYVSTG